MNPNTSPPEGKWTTGICGCFGDVTNSCFTAARNCFMLVYAFGIGACLYTCTYRAKLRALYSLPPKPCGDCCVHHFCFFCALCQEYRELKNRGLDPEGA
uniref:Uncharacterized protein n=1 Tax=Quercus lobata TaxID=97700 RepID=A0A7N2L5D1_QUELO